MNRVLGVGLVGYVAVPCRENGRKAFIHGHVVLSSRSVDGGGCGAATRLPMPLASALQLVLNGFGVYTAADFVAILRHDSEQLADFVEREAVFPSSTKSSDHQHRGGESTRAKHDRQCTSPASDDQAGPSVCAVEPSRPSCSRPASLTHSRGHL